MIMFLRYQNGITAKAVVLAANNHKMRVAVESQRDTVELLQAGGSWQTESGDAVEIDAIIQQPETDVSRFCAEMRPRVMAAGLSFTAF